MDDATWLGRSRTRIDEALFAFVRERDRAALVARLAGCAPSPLARRAQKLAPDEAAELLLGRPSCRLAVYGSLAPGKPNHHHVEDLAGRWSEGAVHGHLHPTGWGATEGFPGMIWDPAGERVAVRLLESEGLPDRWSHLDDFEGDDYRRTWVSVDVDNRVVVASLYCLSTDPRS